MASKLVLITGGSRGIGAASALLAAKNGWNVVITYRTQETEANTIVEQIIAEDEIGIKVSAMKLDIANEDNVSQVFEQLDHEYGRLDALVNNAGLITPISSFIDMKASRIREVFNINVVGTFLCAQEAVKRMSRSVGGKGGSIVNVSSAAARIGSPNEFIDYAASKGAIDTLTLGLSKEVASQGIRVNAVRPGIILTDLHASAGDQNRPEKYKSFIPMQRAGSAKEVANSIVWLISDDASYVNGALMDVTGGR